MVVAREAIDDVVCCAFNTWFSLCISLLEEVGEAQCLDSAIEDDDRVYHT